MAWPYHCQSAPPPISTAYRLGLSRAWATGATQNLAGVPQIEDYAPVASIDNINWLLLSQAT